MSDTERMDALDAEIARYIHEAMGREGTITGWVLSFSHDRFDEDGDHRYGFDYAVGPQTNFMASVGLIRTTQVLMDRAVWRAGDRSGDDE